MVMAKARNPITARAWCYRSGELVFGEDAPEGVIVIAEVRGPTVEQLREKLETRARLAYDGETLLVPGIPEAKDGDAALKALAAWRDWALAALAGAL